MSTDLPSFKNDAYWRDPFTLKHLIYVLRVYEELKAKDAAPGRENAVLYGSAEAASRMETYRDRLRVSAVLANAPGIDRIKLLCDKLEPKPDNPTAINVVKLRVKVCDAKPCTLKEADALTLDDVADVLESAAAKSETPIAAKQAEGGTPPDDRSKGIPRAEAEVLVREWLAANAKDDPAGITRDAVAAATDVSAGQVSKTAAWKAFRERRDAEAKPRAREVPLTDAMKAVIPSNCERPAELAALIEEQEKDKAEQERRHKRRHGPS